MHIDLADAAQLQCSKKNCRTGNYTIHRHHKGSQHMWLAHFRSRRHTPKYQKFYARYHRFAESDIVRLCHDHHEEIHVEYYRIIREVMHVRDYKPCREWSWVEAHHLMTKLEAFCNWWLKQETPGVSEHKLT